LTNHLARDKQKKINAAVLFVIQGEQKEQFKEVRNEKN
jgi:hypothetical protein